MSRLSENKFYYLFISLFIVVILSLLHLIGILRPVESYFVRIFAPVQGFLFRQGQNISGSLSLIWSLKEINDENSILDNRVHELENELASLKEVQNENNLFREQLGFAEKKPYETIPALVVAADPVTTLQSITIDQGKKDGVRDGKPAITANGTLVGRVFEAQDKSARILLISDPNSAIIGLTQDSRADGVLKGEHGLALSMTNISQDKDIKTGESIVTAGMEDGMPKGLLIGEVQEVISRDNELFKEAKIKPLADFKKLEMVFIIK